MSRPDAGLRTLSVLIALFAMVVSVILALGHEWAEAAWFAIMAHMSASAAREYERVGK